MENRYVREKKHRDDSCLNLRYDIIVSRVYFHTLGVKTDCEHRTGSD